MKLLTVTGAAVGYSWMVIGPLVVFTVAWYVWPGTMQIGCGPMNVWGPVCVEVMQEARAEGLGEVKASENASPEARTTAMTTPEMSSGLQGRPCQRGGRSAASSRGVTIGLRTGTFALLIS